jgi:CheY-like chemotaxis protein
MPDFARHRILCVDDDSDTLNVRRLLLEGAGYSVLTAASGKEALQVLETDPRVELVLLDYLMPGMNGDALAEKIRQHYPKLSLVLISAIGQLPPSLLARVDSYVQKGQGPEVLLSVLSGHLASSSPAVERAPVQKTVLCVEDEKLHLERSTLLFQSAGYAVLQAQSESTAMEIFRSQHVDAVVMDYWLLGRHGTAVAEEMKHLRPQVPIVMLSGFSSLPGEGAIVDAWLQKAKVAPEDVVDEVTRLISLRGDDADIEPSVS